MSRSASSYDLGYESLQSDEDASYGPRSRRLRPTKKKTPWYLKMFIIVGSVLMVVSGGTLALVLGALDRYEGKVDRENILDGVPAAETGGGAPMNFLMLGSDSQAGKSVEDFDAEGSRSDTIMLVHIDKERKGAFIASIPRDSYVNVPAGGKWRGGKNKINAAFSFGGANLTAKTVYELTKIPLNGAAIVNLSGVNAMVTAVGGVRVCIPYTVRSAFSPKVWEKGCHNMTPADAEEFVRQRKGTPGGDLGRIKNQQHVMKALAEKATQSEMLTNPAKLDRLLTTVAESLTVDKNMNLRDLAFALKDIRPENIKFATVPITGTMMTDAGSSVQLDMAEAEKLFAAIRDDTADAWLAAHPQPEVASL